MKIKHIAGYGFVNAKKLELKTKSTGYTKITKLKVRVIGDHERGIVFKDSYDGFYWLVKKHFLPDANYADLTKYECEQVFLDGVSEDACDYTFTFNAYI